VPVLIITSASQETVTWSAYPHSFGSPGFLANYRRDHDDNPGTTYEPRNEMLGATWEMMTGHFDMLPRDYQFVADWLAAVAKARLPAQPGAPLKTLVLRDGWLVDPNIPASGDLPGDYAVPAPYQDFKGPRNKALWFPTEALARTFFEIVRDEPRRQIEMFTFLDPAGQPISLAHGSLAAMPTPQLLLKDDGEFTITTHHFTAPFDICTIKEKGHDKDPNATHAYANVLFPGRSSLPVSAVPLQFDPNGGPIELVRTETFKDERGVSETRFTLKLKRHRLAPDAGFCLFFCRAYHEGDKLFAAAGRTCQIAWVPQDIGGKGAVAQTIAFPTIPDARAATAKIPLQATSSAKLPVDYFVLKGPGVVRDGALVPTEVPVGFPKPIEVTIGAYQVGVYKATGGVRAAPTVYQTFHLLP
jgi:hypothetical protein